MRKHRRLYGYAALLMAGVMMLLAAGEAMAALCVWRNPDADIKEFFGGGTYRTLLVRVGAQKAAIERAIGTSLDPDENELRFWPVMRGGRRVGTVATHLGRGDYGAIEVVMALEHPAGGRARVKAVKIQRDRERFRAQLRSDTFLRQFVGKTAANPITVGRDIKPAHANAMQGSRIVALSVKKLLVAYEALDIAKK